MKLYHYAPLLLSSITFAHLKPSAYINQPQRAGVSGTYELIGNSLVSGQQMFLGTNDKVYIVDKAENNPTQINGHPAWAQEWALGSNEQRAMEIVTNTFCAGGNVLGNGTWINVGGNQGVTYGGEADNEGSPYRDEDGRRSVRLLTPCDDGSCNWVHSPFQIDERWYPTVETLEDGSVIIIGGCRWGGYVNTAGQNNPTYEFFPSRGAPITSQVLERTLPTNLFPLTWLLPSGRLLMQSNWETVLLDYKNQKEIVLDDMPDAVRTYPASAGTVMLPLTPENNWTATIMFCGGSNVPTSMWTDPDFIVIDQPASSSCVKITPDISPSYEPEDPLPELWSMVNLILLPDGTIFCANGARRGTAGYGNDTWAVGHSYADDPHFTPIIYNGNAEKHQKWSKEGLSSTTIPRMYHSAAVLLPDGSILISGSNPNPDYNGNDVKYPTEYRTEIFYPPYYSSRRPEPTGLPERLSYGGYSFNLSLSLGDLFSDISMINRTKVVVIRPGFSTHSMNMGQRSVELQLSYTFQQDKTVTLHVSQLPPNPAILVPGPALIFVVVNGIPSIGKHVMIGSGELGEQKILPVEALPTSSLLRWIHDLGGQHQDVNRINSNSGKAENAGPAILLGVFVTILVMMFRELLWL